MSRGISLGQLHALNINKLNVVVNTETRTFASQPSLLLD